MRNNAIIIVLLIFLAVTSFFWFQSMSTGDLPAVKSPTPPVVSGKEAENFIRRAEELLIDYREPLPELYGRDPFHKEKPIEETETAVDPSRIFTLSSIIFSDLNALAVVNDEILAEGDTIYDRASGSEFMIESIEVDRIEVINNDKKYILQKAPKRD